MTVAAIDTRVRASATPAFQGGDYIVRRGDTLSNIAQRNGVSLQSLIRANPQISNPDLIFAGQRVAIPGGGEAGRSYTVQRGDTLSGIAARFGVDYRDVARDNAIANPNLILPGQTLRIGGVQAPAAQGAGAVDGAAGTGGVRNAATVAEQYLGRNASDLKRDGLDQLPMDPNVPNNVCCANFVSGVLIEAGQLPPSAHTNSVAELKSTMQRSGFTQVSASEVRPGDVAIIQGNGISHTEIVADRGRMIGSNNSNPDGSQRVGYHDLSFATRNGATFWRAPAAAALPAPGSAPGSAPGAAPVDGAVPASRQGRIDYAINYFEGQGWTRAQAVGIVANLDLESGMNPHIQQIGGGPGYGLAQWEGPRQADFRAWAGKDIRQSTFTEQLRFIQHELTGTERGAGNRLRNATDAATAAELVTRYYERPADIAGDSAKRATRALELMQGR